MIWSLDRLCIDSQDVGEIHVHGIMKPSARQSEYLSALKIALPKRIVTGKAVSM